MFTFGIFSTHIPYIAFVLFYGFFFLAGIEKASAGDFGDGQQLIPEVYSHTIDESRDIGFNISDNNDCYYEKTEPEQLLLYEKMIDPGYFLYISFKTDELNFSWFSRPPPVF